MRIWLQSATALGKDPRVNSYEESIKTHALKVARHDTVVSIHGVDEVLGRPDLYHLAGHIESSWLIKKALQAEHDGYDAYVQVCTLDPATHAIREALHIPTVFVLESSVLLACSLAPTFSFLAHNESLLLRITEKVKEYGLASRMTPGGCLNLNHKDFNVMYQNPKPYLDALIEKGTEVVEKGAGIILVSGGMTNLFLLDHGIREIKGAPVLDQFGVAIKMGELMVDLTHIGVERSKQGLYLAPSKEELPAYLRYLGSL
ncbi:aspartate/glutamate racemase family protein [Chloroflexota bacterium]